MMGYSIFSNLPDWSLIIRSFNVISRMIISGKDYPSAEMQSVYSTTTVNWACRTLREKESKFNLILRVWRKQKQVLHWKCCFVNCLIDMSYAKIYNNWFGIVHYLQKWTQLFFFFNFNINDYFVLVEVFQK